MNKALRFTIVAASAAVSVSVAADAKIADARTANPLSQPIPAAIRARYLLIEKLINTQASPEAIGNALYWPDVIIAGEGGKTQRGFAAMMADMPDTLKFIGHECKWSFNDPAIVTGSLVGAYTGLTCKQGPKPDLAIRVLYVWQKRGAQWRVVRESYTMDPK